MNLRVVIPIAIILLMAGQSLAVQFLTLDRWKDFVLLDLAAAALLVQFCRPYLLRVCIVLQGMCSLFVLSYHTALGMSPTLADLINGTAYAIDMGAISLFYHVDMIALVWLVPCCGLLFLLCGKKYSTNHIRRWSLLSFSIIIIALILTLDKQPLSDFFPENYTRGGGGKDYFASPGRRSLQLRGYLCSFALELGTKSAWSFRNLRPLPCSDEGIEAIPVPPKSSCVALIQVESLDWDLLHRKVEGELVMPFLHSLLPNSIVLPLDGTKKLASANSDFEIFNGQEAIASVVHYEFLTNYPRSIFQCLKKEGRRTIAFHGLPADYMNLEAAYKLMGIEKFRALESIKADGVIPLPVWWAGVIRDEDLLAYAAERLPSGPFVQFIITMNMHLPEHVGLLSEHPLFHSPDASFLTTARTTDDALRHYVEALPEDTLLILWGDHRSYGRSTGDVPFIIHTKGQSHPFDGTSINGLTRCKMYYYLRKIFSCQDLQMEEDIDRRHGECSSSYHF